MKSKLDVEEAIISIQVEDQHCPALAHVQGTACFDFGHAIRGTWISVLRWILDENVAPWEK